MKTINNLSSSDSLSLGDLLAFWSSNNGDTRKVSMNTLVEFIQAQGGDADISTTSTITGLKDINPNTNTSNYIVLGGTILGDGLGGIYHYDSTSTLTVDDFLVVDSDVIGVDGRWLRMDMNDILVVDTVTDMNNLNIDALGATKTVFVKDNGSFYTYNGSAWVNNTDFGLISSGKVLQLRRGTVSENNAFTGAAGEVVVDTTNNRLRVHDGATVGGFPIGEFANVLDFGAKGDDSTNDTQAFVDALAASDYVYIPAGIYKINSIDIAANKILEGAGLSTIIKPYSTGITIFNIPDPNPSGTSPRHIRIKNMQVNGAEFSKTCTFVGGDRFSAFKMEDVYTSSLYATLDAKVDQYIVELNKVFMTNCVYGIKQKDNLAAGTSWNINNCTLEYSEHGYEFNELRYSSMNNCTIDNLYKGVYAYDFNRCNFSVDGCGSETVWQGASSNYGSGLFRATGSDCAISVTNSAFWGGNQYDTTVITKTDLGLTDDIVFIKNAAVTFNNTSFRAFTDRNYSFNHLPFTAGEGSHVMVFENGNYSDYTGQYWARVTDWGVASTGKLFIQTNEVIRHFSDGIKKIDITPDNLNVVNWQGVGLIDIDATTYASGSYRVNTGGGSTGTLPSGNSGYGLYTAIMSPDKTTGYAMYIDNNGLTSTRTLTGGTWNSWTYENGQIDRGSSFNMDSWFTNGVKRVNVGAGTTGTYPTGYSGYGFLETNTNGTYVLQRYYDNNGVAAFRQGTGGSYGSWKLLT